MPGALYAPVPETEHYFSGEERPWTVDVIDADGNPQNLVGFDLEWTLWEREPQPDAAPETALVTLTTGDSRITIEDTPSGTPGNNARATWTPTYAETSTLAGRYWHRLARTNAGSRTVLAFGPVVIAPSGL